MEKAEAIKRLERQREALSTLQARAVEDATYLKWIRDTELAIDYVFGKETRHLPDFHDVSWTPGSYDMYNPDPEWHRAFIRGRDEADALLRSMIEEIAEYWPDEGVESAKTEKPKKVTRKVFIVHGRKEAAREMVARFLERLKLTPIILHEQPNKGRTIIEKFVDYADVSFAVVLLTADDRGGLSDILFEQQKLRARQNVILELGFFIGRLGRDRVCALYENGVEIPSDYDGVLFVQLDQGGAWRMSLAREIKAAGITVDMNDAV